MSTKNGDLPEGSLWIGALTRNWNVFAKACWEDGYPPSKKGDIAGDIAKYDIAGYKLINQWPVYIRLSYLL